MLIFVLLRKVAFISVSISSVLLVIVLFNPNTRFIFKFKFYCNSSMDVLMNLIQTRLLYNESNASENYPSRRTILDGTFLWFLWNIVRSFICCVKLNVMDLSTPRRTFFANKRKRWVYACELAEIINNYQEPNGWLPRVLSFLKALYKLSSPAFNVLS